MTQYMLVRLHGRGHPDAIRRWTCSGCSTKSTSSTQRCRRKVRGFLQVDCTPAEHLHCLCACKTVKCSPAMVPLPNRRSSSAASGSSKLPDIDAALKLAAEATAACEAPVEVRSVPRQPSKLKRT